jgi:flagellar protein FliO/FliZ
LLSRLGIDASPAVQYVIAFAVIFGLLALLALGLRRLTASRVSMAAQDRGRARQPRLGIVDVYDLDRQRQLILLRRDNVEHLLLIGGPNDLVVETNIVRTPARGAASGENGFDRIDQGADAPARPVVEPPRPGLESGVSGRLGSVAGPGNDTPKTDAELAPSATTPPQPARPREPLPKPDTIAPAPVRTSGAAPSATVRAPEPRRADSGPGDRPMGGGATAPDPSALSDMAKQLEQALRRPAPGAPSQPTSPAMPRVEAAPAQPAQAEPPRPTPPPPRRPDIVRPAAPTRPVPTPRPAEPAAATDGPEQRADGSPTQSPAAPVASQPTPAPAAQPAPEPAQLPAAPPPAPAPASAPSAPPPPSPAPAPAARPGASDPFSVEEIEAEFARLLGRPVDKA